MDEKIRDEDVKVIRDYKIANYLVSKGYRIINLKKYRDFICDVTNLPCDKRSVFVFFVEGDFLIDLEYAKEFYNEIKKDGKYGKI
jgi:hypothetical protein